jgi:hypothetical protein
MPHKEAVMAADFPAAFQQLREILRQHTDGMIVLKDKPNDFTVITQAIGPNKKPIWFGAVMMKKSAVTYHLFPLYFNPALQATVSPELAKRKQGKTCFNFQRPDDGLFAQIEALTQRGRECFEKHGMLNAGAVRPDQLDAALAAAGNDPKELAKLRKQKGEAAAAKRIATIRKNASRSR